MLIFDYLYGWMPLNIKITTTKTNDNTSNLISCVYSYTDEKIDLLTFKNLNNNKMSLLLFEKLKNKQYNKIDKKDYYFLIINKLNTKEIIINSIKGLSYLETNLNNLPFQIKWNKNKNFNYSSIENKIKLFINCLNKNEKQNWREIFLNNMKTLKSTL